MLKSRKAFTLVELVIVIAVIAILAAVLIPTFSNIISKANESVDTQFVANLNKQLKIYSAENKIEDESDLWDFLIELYGENVNETLTPKATKKGNHFWYNTQTNTVQYGTLEDVYKSNFRILSKKTFNTNSLRIFNNKYYLLDKDGSDIAKLINQFENLINGDDYIDAISKIDQIKLENSELLQSFKTEFVNKLSSTVIVTNNGSFRYSNLNNVTNIYFSMGITRIASELYIVDSLNNILTTTSQEKYLMFIDGERNVNLPDTITSVETSGLFFYNGTANLYGKFKTIEDVKKIFRVSSTNGIIKIESNDLIVSNDKLSNTDGTLVPNGELSYSNPVSKFDICYDESEKLKYVNGILYVAYDMSEFTLRADNFLGENNSSTVASRVVSWSSSNEEYLEISSTGVVTIKLLPSIGDTSEIVISGKADAGGHEESITVCIVRVNSASLKLESTDIFSLAEPIIQLVYDGTKVQYNFTDFSTSLNYTSLNISVDDTLSITTNGDLFSISGTTLTLNEYEGTQSINIKVGEYLEITATIIVIDESANTFESPFENDYLYRVGNKNSVKLSSLFTSEKPGNNITLTIYDASKTVNGNKNEINTDGVGFSATYTKTLNSNSWSNSTIQFTGTGVAILVITNESGSFPLALEVVEGTNITGTYNESEKYFGFSSFSSGNVVLLNDVKFTGTTYLTLSNCTLFGNGFTVDVTNAAHQNDSTYANIFMSTANMDNVRVLGAVYPGVGGSQHADYFAAAVRTTGNCKILNSYISNCRVALRVDDDTLVENSILDGGSLANVEVRTGKLTLKNSTTINTLRPDSYNQGKQVMGLGVTIYDGASTASIKIEGTIKQYNWVGENTHKNYFKEGYLKTAFDLVFSEGANNMYYEHNNDKFINTGFVCLSSLISQDNINTISGYLKTTVSYDELFTKFNGWLMSLDMTSQTNKLFFEEEVPSRFINSEQSPYVPIFSFDFNDEVNKISKEGDGSNDNRYCVYEDNKIVIKSMNNEDPVSIKVDSLLKASKYSGQVFGISVKCYDQLKNNQIISDGNITLNVTGEYILQYTISDNLFYDSYGAISAEVISYTYNVPIIVNIAKADQKDAEISDVTSTTTYKSPSGKTNYVPTAYTGSSIAGFDYVYLAPICDVNITDYDENNNSESLDLNNYTNIDIEKSTNTLYRVILSYSNNRKLEIVIEISYSGGQDVTAIYSYENKLYFVKGNANGWYDTSMTLTYSYTGYNGNELQDCLVKKMNWYGDSKGTSWFSGTKTDWEFSKMTKVKE